MKVKMDTLVSGYGALQALGNKQLTPFPTAYRVGKAITAVQAILKAGEVDRMAIFKKHGAVNEETKMIEVPEEAQPAFQIDMDTLMQTEVEINIHPIAITDLGTTGIEGALLGVLDGWFIVSPE